MKYKLVKDLMTTPAIYVEDSTTIKEAISILKENNIGFLPITKKEIIVGVVTDRDILVRGIGIYKLNTKISKVMTSGNIFFVSPTTPVDEAAKIMAKNKIRRLVVLDNGYVKGVITTKNLLNEPSLLPYITKTYISDKTLPSYSSFSNSNPHDSIDVNDYPL